LRRFHKWCNEFLVLILVTCVYNIRLCVGLSTTSDGNVTSETALR